MVTAFELWVITEIYTVRSGLALRIPRPAPAQRPQNSSLTWSSKFVLSFARHMFTSLFSVSWACTTENTSKQFLSHGGRG